LISADDRQTLAFTFDAVTLGFGLVIFGDSESDLCLCRFSGSFATDLFFGKLAGSTSGGIVGDLQAGCCRRKCEGDDPCDKEC